MSLPVFNAELFCASLWQFLSSKAALIVYAAVLIAVLIALIIVLLINESRKSDALAVTVEHKNTDNGGENGTGEKGNDKKEEFVDGQPRFARLTEIDEERKKQKTVTFDNGVTLKDLCEDFRNFCAGELKLYYTPSHIRQFVSGLSVSHILLMQGMSGTGKTSLAVAFGHYLKNESAVIPIQPMWKERTENVRSERV